MKERGREGERYGGIKSRGRETERERERMESRKKEI